MADQREEAITKASQDEIQALTLKWEEIGREHKAMAQTLELRDWQLQNMKAEMSNIKTRLDLYEGKEPEPEKEEVVEVVEEEKPVRGRTLGRKLGRSQSQPAEGNKEDKSSSADDAGAAKGAGRGRGRGRRTQGPNGGNLPTAMKERKDGTSQLCAMAAH